MSLLAITVGDINGVGPEVSLKAAHTHSWPEDMRLVLVGNADILTQQAEACGFPVPPRWKYEKGRETEDRVTLWEPMQGMRVSWTPGQVHPEASILATDWIRSTVRGCQQGWFDAMITAPICKEGLQKAGLNLPGHTEYLARLTRTKRFAMMLLGGPLRVVLVTRHIPLDRVAASLTTEKIVEAIRITAEGLPWLGCAEARIGVCGLNPHAGDGGAIGSEEQEIIAPAIEAAKAEIPTVEGPVPSDVIFYKAANGQYDAVVCMYHDQGLGPLKMMAFKTGVNVTLGLPIVRTSPDHGTAFDIAGQGKADPSSMIEAIKLARELAGRENPWRKK